MNEVSATQYVDFLRQQEGLRLEPYQDDSPERNWTIGYGHKIAEGENFGNGITKDQAENLLSEDIRKHYNRVRSRVGEEQFDALSETDRFKLLDMDFNVGVNKFPKFRDAVLSGNVEEQIAEHKRYAGGKPLGRNKHFKELFYGEDEIEDRSDEPLIQKEPVRESDTPLTTLLKSDEFEALSPDQRVQQLLDSSQDFRTLYDRDKEEANRVANTLFNHYANPEPSMFASIRSSAEGGWDQGIGAMQLTLSNLAMLIEEAGIENDFDDSWMKASELNFIDAERKIGSNWYDQVVSIIASLPGGLAVPGIATLGVGSGLGLIPAAATMAPFVAPVIGFGVTGAIAEAHRGKEAALKRGAIDAALGAIPGATAHLSRLTRMGIETAAAYSVMEGDDFQSRMVQALPLGIIAGAPARRAPYALMEKLGVKNRFKEHRLAVEEAKIAQKKHAQTSAAMQQVVHVLDESGRPRPIGTLQDAFTAYKQMLSGEHPMSMRAQDRDGYQQERIDRRDIESMTDPRPISREVRVEGRRAAMFRPGPWWSDNRKFTIGTHHLEKMMGKKFKRPGEVLTPLAKALKIPVHFGLSKKERAFGTSGEYWLPFAPQRSMRINVDRRPNIQTGAHEIGHHLAFRKDGFNRYQDLRDPQLQADFARLDEIAMEYDVGPAITPGGDEIFTGIYTDKNGQATVSGIFKLYKDGKLPEDLNWMPEVLGHSYDRDNLAEGWAELFRVWTTNNKDFGGEINLNLTAPHAMKLIEDWMKRLPRKDRKAIKKFQNDAHEHLAMQADVALGMGFGADMNPSAVMAGNLAKFRQSVTDDFSGFMNLEKAIYGHALPDGVYETMRLLRGTSEAAARMVELGRPVWKTEEYIDTNGRKATRRLIDYEGKSLSEIFAPVSHTAARQNLAMKYIQARQSKELAGQAFYKGRIIELDKVTSPTVRAQLKRGFSRENLFDDKQIEAGLQLGEKHPEFVKLFDELKEFAEGMADFGQEAGLWGAGQRAQWKRREFIYSFFREMDDAGRASNAMSNALRGDQPFSVLKGSSRQLRNPMMNLLETHARTFKLAMENIAKQKLVDTIQFAEGGGRFGQILKPIPIMKDFEFEKIREAAAKEIRKKYPGMAPEDVKKILDVEFPNNAGLEQLTMFIGNRKPHGDNVLTVYRDGKPVYYQIDDPMLVRSIQAMRRPNLFGFSKYWNDLRKFKQRWITRGPGFMLANLWRDAAMASIMSRTGNVHFGKAISGMWSAARQDKAFQELIANGGGGAGIRDDFKGIQRRMIRHARKTGFDPRRLIITPADALRALDDIGRTMEYASRLGEYKAARKQGMSAQHAAYLAREVSTDFAMRGDDARMNMLSNIIPFFNAMVAGGDRLGRSIAADPTHKAASAIKMATVGMASMGLYALNREIAEYMALPQWDKDGYWHIYIPKWSEEGERLRNPKGSRFEGQLAYTHYKLPKLWEVGLLGSLGERTLQSIYDSDDESETKLGIALGHMVTQNFGINLEGQSWPVPMPVGFDSAIEMFSNRVLFTGNPIESAARANQMEWLRRRTGAPRVWGEYGRLVAETPVPDILESPAMAENLARGFFGEFVGIAAVLADEVFFPEGPRKPLTRVVPGTSRFFEEYGKYTNDAREFYDRKESVNKLAASFNWMASHPGELETIQEWSNDDYRMSQIGLSDKMDQISASISTLSKMQERIEMGEVRGTREELEERIREIVTHKRILMDHMNQVAREIDRTYRK